ncbi:MAG: DegT/DnrJ/EryC1/StrS aminotransferase family protein [Firmicutes bacterium]|nr:DegT/DnrJ/EryC1/StrS aminotransferase family protein [Bacillota bacterium]
MPGCRGAGADVTPCSLVTRFRANLSSQVLFSFVASGNRICYERRKPVFVDIQPYTANIDPNLIEDAITFCL